MIVLVRIIVLGFLALPYSLIFGQVSLPDVELRNLENKKVTLTEVVKSNQLTILSFWATWCSPCKKELDAIADVYTEWQEEYNVELIAISVDNARAMARVKPMVVEKGWPYQIFIDPNQNLMRALNFQTVPHTILLDRNGKIVYSHSGYLPGDEIELEQEMQALSK